MKIIDKSSRTKLILLIYDCENTYDIIKFVFYTLTDDFFVILSKEKNYIKAELTIKKNIKINIKELNSKIIERIKDEILREKIDKGTSSLKKFIIKKAIK